MIQDITLPSELTGNFGVVSHGINVQELILDSHRIAVSKGWWENGVNARPLPEQIANFHAEASEAWEEYRAGRMETRIETNGKPEGFWVEIADVLIRIGDTAGAYGIRPQAFPGKHAFAEEKTTIPQFICTLHTYIAMCRRNDSTTHNLDTNRLLMIVKLCTEFAEFSNMTSTLQEAISLKHAYNMTRPHRHGGKKA